MWRYLVITCGIACVVFAVVSFPIPGVPSSAFLLAGAAMLAKTSPAIDRWLREHRWLGGWIRRIEKLPRRNLVIILVVWLAILVTTGWLAIQWAS